MRPLLPRNNLGSSGQQKIISKKVSGQYPLPYRIQFFQSKGLINQLIIKSVVHWYICFWIHKKNMILKLFFLIRLNRRVRTSNNNVNFSISSEVFFIKTPSTNSHKKYWFHPMLTPVDFEWFVPDLKSVYLVSNIF